MYDGLLVIDADAHKMENPVVFFDYLDAPYRARLSSRTDRYGQPRLVIRDLDPRTRRDRSWSACSRSPTGRARAPSPPSIPETAIGGVFNRIRIEHMDREGIDAQVLYGSMTLSFEAILDPELAVACMRAYNDYIADDCRPSRGRLFPVGFISLADVDEAVREVRRCVEELGMIGVHVPPSLPVPHPAAPDAFPDGPPAEALWPSRLPPDPRRRRRARRRASACTARPACYLPSGIAEQVDTFILSHIFGHRNQMQMALATCVFEGVFDRFPTLRMGFLEAGCGWLPDLVHAFHEHWEKRIRDFDPDTRMLAMAQFAQRAAARARRRGRQATPAAQAAAGAATSTGARRSEARGRATRDAFLFEHRALDHDPVDFFRRGQVFVELRVGRPGARLPARGARRDGRGPGLLQRRLRPLGRRAHRLREERRPRPRAYDARAPGEAAGGQLPALLRPAARAAVAKLAA